MSLEKKKLFNVKNMGVDVSLWTVTLKLAYTTEREVA
jgi:hypothetical protein